MGILSASRIGSIARGLADDVPLGPQTASLDRTEGLAVQDIGFGGFKLTHGGQEGSATVHSTGFGSFRVTGTDAFGSRLDESVDVPGVSSSAGLQEAPRKRLEARALVQAMVERGAQPHPGAGGYHADGFTPSLRIRSTGFGSYEVSDGSHHAVLTAQSTGFGGFTVTGTHPSGESVSIDVKLPVSTTPSRSDALEELQKQAILQALVPG